jgi:hypothetical protein
MNIYYVYAYLRTDGTPYYIGKGQKMRYLKPHPCGVPPVARITFIKEHMSNADACSLEIELIAKYGRKDLDTGILRNRTAGGEGLVAPGPETRKKLSDAKIGKKPNNYGKTYVCKTGAENRSKAKSGENHPYYGKERSPSERQNISDGIRKGWHTSNRPVLTCPHCGKEGKVGMTRWHFDNCKFQTP